MRRLLVVALTVIGLACGRSSPTAAPSAAPPTPQPTPTPVLTFVDGVTDTQVFPDEVIPASPNLGANVTVRVFDHFVREQRWTGEPIAVWPLEGGSFGERGRYFRELVYGGENHHPLLRWPGLSYSAVMGMMSLELEARVPEIQRELSGVFGAYTEAGGPAFEWRASTPGDLTVKIDPADVCLQPNYVSCARWWQDGSAITRAELIFRSVDHVFQSSISMHSMGHIVGLSDWPLPGAAMQHSGNLNALERAAIHMMYRHRVAGNTEPDRDPAFAASSQRRGRELHEIAH